MYFLLKIIKNEWFDFVIFFYIWCTVVLFGAHFVSCMNDLLEAG